MSRGVVSLVFDDGYEDVFRHVVPLLRKHRIRATFAIPVNTEQVAQTHGASITSFNAWKEACAREGHELAAHGVTHRALTTLNDQELTQELEQSRSATGATTLVYPGGACDERVRREAARLFRAARTTQWGVESVPPRDPYALHTLNATQNNFRPWKFRVRELQSILTHGWVIETFHRITPTPIGVHDVSLDAFAAHLSWLSRLPSRIATIRDVMHDASP